MGWGSYTILMSAMDCEGDGAYGENPLSFTLSSL